MRLLVPVCCLLVALAIAGCSSDPTSSSPPASPREVSATVTFDANGISSPVSFAIPTKTRSVTVVVEGQTSQLYGLASFVMADGLDRVAIDLGTSHAAEMKRSYFDEQVGTMPGSLDQSIRLGTFTHVYPYAPTQSVVPGTASVRIAESSAEGSATVKILMPEDDGAKVLHLDVVRVSDTATMTSPPSFVDKLRAIYAPVGLDVVIDEVVTVPGTGYATITTFTEPQEAPDSESAKLAMAVAPKTPSSKALRVMIVDALPSGVAGLSLGVPGPPVPGSYYFGVVVEAADDATLGRVVAHEVAHFLGLQHVQNKGTSGKVYSDPLEDTSPTVPNLMTKGTELTVAQGFVLGRSALLTTE